MSIYLFTYIGFIKWIFLEGKKKHITWFNTKRGELKIFAFCSDEGSFFSYFRICKLIMPLRVKNFIFGPLHGKKLSVYCWKNVFTTTGIAMFTRIIEGNGKLWINQCFNRLLCVLSNGLNPHFNTFRSYPPL